MGIWFGTDGIRGRAGDAPMTPDFALRLGHAVGKVMGGSGSGPVLIGKDTRVSGYLFESALEAGLSAAGIDVALLGPMPTPAVAYLTQTFRATAGIVISASHNPYYDNGFKFFGPDGDKLSDATEQAIETELSAASIRWNLGRPGKASRISDAAGRYIEFCKSAIPARARLNGLRVVIDCAHGATYTVAPKVFSELGATVEVMGDEPDGYNINEGVGALYPRPLVDRVLASRADLGVALDGDGDRLILVDATGRVIDGDRILGILALAHHATATLGGGVVGTVMTNQGLPDRLESEGIAFERVAVGDRHILQRLRERDWLLGGEGSGHIVCLRQTTTGDGIISALMVADEMRRGGRTLAELADEISLFPQVLVNVPLPPGFDARALLEDRSVVQACREVETGFAGNGRVLLRPSGTEPLVRVMVEARDADLVRDRAEWLASRISALIEAD